MDFRNSEVLGPDTFRPDSAVREPRFFVLE